METPIWDYVSGYGQRGPARFHMPGHKGRRVLGPEGRDITEIAGADELYRSRGIIRRSEEHAARLFGTARTLYSAEGSSLSIRAMLLLALWRAEELGLPRRILAGRNAHRALMSAAALLDLEVDWLFPRPGEGLLSCTVDPEAVADRLRESGYMAVYLTSPDYLGAMAPIGRVAEVCRRAGVPLLVDNAHGAYLRFLRPDSHPITLGADLCCDSAHKTLPCLTGAGYLHIASDALWNWEARAEEAMAVFGSTSPSYLILQSLDLANRALAGDYPSRAAETVSRLRALKEKLESRGWRLAGQEPMKLTLKARSLNWTGGLLAEELRRRGVECEFADPDFLTLMPSPDTSEEEWNRLERVLGELPEGGTPGGAPPDPGLPRRAVSIREALLSPAERIPLEEAENRILADPEVSCPPAVPVRVPGERMDSEAIACFRYYGKETCLVLRKK